MSEPRYVYSTDGETYNHDNPEDAIDDALTRCSSEDFKVGVELSYHKAIARDFVPSDFVDIDSIIDNMDCRATDEAGEWAEDFTYCSPEALDELEHLVSDWANRHLTCSFYGIREDEEITFTITEEMYEEYK